jgi:hypothetical protein
MTIKLLSNLFKVLFIHLYRYNISIGFMFQ